MKQLFILQLCLLVLAACANTVTPTNGMPVIEDTSQHIITQGRAHAFMDSVRGVKKKTPEVKEIDYVLYKRNYPPDAHITSDWYSVVIRSIDPAKDNYKAYCRYIVRDIVKKRGNDMDLVIEIYDSKKAYEMYEGINEGIILTKKEMQFVEQHGVGAYDGPMSKPMEEAPGNILHFYEDGPKKYKGYEDFNP